MSRTEVAVVVGATVALVVVVGAAVVVGATVALVVVTGAGVDVVEVDFHNAVKQLSRLSEGC